MSIGSIEPIEGFEDRLKLEFDLSKQEGFKITLKKARKGNSLFFYCHVDDEIILKEKYFGKLRQVFVNRVAKDVYKRQQCMKGIKPNNNI